MLCLARKRLTDRGHGDNFRGENHDRCLSPPGRPTTFDDELGERIINSLWTGECKSLVEVEAQDWAPTRRTIHLWKKRYPEFGSALIEAQMALGDVYVHENQKIIAKMLSGALDPSAANVAIRSNQWVAQSVDPRTYANKSYVDKNENKTVTHVFSNKIPVEDLSEDELDALEGALVKSKLMITGPKEDLN